MSFNYQIRILNTTTRETRTESLPLYRSNHNRTFLRKALRGMGHYSRQDRLVGFEVEKECQS